MSYPKLADVRQSLRIKWYRCPMDTAQLHELLKRSDWQGFKQAGGHLGLWLLTASLVYFCWSSQAWFAMIVAMLAHGVVSSFWVGVAPHELGHGTVFRTPVLNKIFLYLFSIVSWWDPFDYASSHTYHHRYTLHPNADRENLLPLVPNTRWSFLLQMMTFNLLTAKGRSFSKGGFIAALHVTILSALGRHGRLDVPSNEWLAALHADQPQQFRKSIWWSRFLLALHGTVAVLSLISGQWIFIFIVSLVAFTCNIQAYLVGLTQHCGLKENDTDFRKSVRSIKVNPLLEFIYWHMNWHTEHHMFAGVPCYNLKKLHQAISSDMPRPRTLREAWREMLDTYERQKEDPEYFFDTPVPAPVARAGTHKESELASSIGELAPKGL